MASSLSRTMYRKLLQTTTPIAKPSNLSYAFYSKTSSSSSECSSGLDVGVYKAILIRQVGQNPGEKKLKSGRTMNMQIGAQFSGTE